MSASYRRRRGDDPCFEGSGEPLDGPPETRHAGFVVWEATPHATGDAARNRRRRTVAIGAEDTRTSRRPVTMAIMEIHFLGGATTANLDPRFAWMDGDWEGAIPAEFVPYPRRRLTVGTMARTLRMMPKTRVKHILPVP